MSNYFLDTSALVKRQINETGHEWIRALCRPSAGNTIIISEIALTEVVASFCRMARENPPRLNIQDRDRYIARFEQQVRKRYIIVEANRAIFQRAANLCRIHPLRAYDAVQLACALTRRDDDIAMGNMLPTFVCADTILLSVAVLEGLSVENPNNHP